MTSSAQPSARPTTVAREKARAALRIRDWGRPGRARRRGASDELGGRSAAFVANALSVNARPAARSVSAARTHAREPRERGCARELSRAGGAVARGRERKCGVRPFSPPSPPLCPKAGAAPGLFRAAPRPESLPMPPRSPREKGVAPRQCRRGHSKAAGSPSFLSLSLPPSQVLAFSCRCCCCVCVCVVVDVGRRSRRWLWSGRAGGGAVAAPERRRAALQAA
jgi:hypothetical protein